MISRSLIKKTKDIIKNLDQLIFGEKSCEHYHLTSPQHTEITTFFGSTDITAAEAETLTDGSDASSLHNHASIYYTETELDAVGGNTGAKADKIDGGTTGNLVSRDANGNIADAGVSVTDLQQGRPQYDVITAATATLDNTQEVINADTTSNTVALTLPLSTAYTTAGESKRYFIRKLVAGNSLTVTLAGSDTFTDGSSTVATVTNVGGVVEVISIGTNLWEISGTYITLS